MAAWIQAVANVIGVLVTVAEKVWHWRSRKRLRDELQRAEAVAERNGAILGIASAACIVAVLAALAAAGLSLQKQAGHG